MNEPSGLFRLVHKIAHTFNKVCLVWLVWLWENFIQNIDHFRSKFEVVNACLIFNVAKDLVCIKIVSNDYSGILELLIKVFFNHIICS